VKSLNWIGNKSGKTRQVQKKGIHRCPAASVDGLGLLCPPVALFVTCSQLVEKKPSQTGRKN
jgi:hypothetical protein